MATVYREWSIEKAQRGCGWCGKPEYIDRPERRRNQCDCKMCESCTQAWASGRPDGWNEGRLEREECPECVAVAEEATLANG